jgi:hypothetical protein
VKIVVCSLVILGLLSVNVVLDYCLKRLTRAGRRRTQETASDRSAAARAEATVEARVRELVSTKQEEAMSETNVTIQTIARFLERRQWRYDVCGGNRIVTGFAGKHATLPMTILLPEDEPYRLMVIVRIAPGVPEGRRPQMAETVVRANYGLKVGCFQMDLGTGALSFVAIVPLADGTVTADQFDAVIEGSMCYTDLYFRAFARLLYADDLSPAEVIAEVEMVK